MGWCAGWLRRVRRLRVVRRVSLLALHQLTCRRLDIECLPTILGCAARAVDIINMYQLLTPPGGVHRESPQRAPRVFNCERAATPPLALAKHGQNESWLSEPL